ncbi:hypothetical protein [Saccharothrix sp. NRRL B-16348]|uniref:hypothetical protein n=1 Tax=Saccharothrix sp. NRRL B-16348 TaxID=1415542 RepID=UPI0012FB6217|nr:hypothetical protein [Saccharothrix sp. NRRL B-16348]
MVVLGTIAAGCSTKEPGDASAGTTTSTTTDQASPTTSTKPSGSGDSLADFDECEVLNSIAPQLNLTDIEVVIGETCGASVSTTASVAVKGHPDLGLDDVVPGGQQSDITIGSRKAKMVKQSTTQTSCLIAVEATPTSRVDVAGSANASLDEACAAATAVATAIEPKLPK